MKAKQLIILVLALLLPVCVFLFLKGFGRNEFSVPPMFVDELPVISPDCPKPTLPYFVSDSIIHKINFAEDSIAMIYYVDGDKSKGIMRIKAANETFPLKFIAELKKKNDFEMKCIYLLKEPFDVVLVDKKGRIRGQFSSTDRDEIDRLRTELAIIFKNY